MAWNQAHVHGFPSQSRSAQRNTSVHKSPTCCSSSDSPGYRPVAGAECCNAAVTLSASGSCCGKEGAGVLTAPHAVNAIPLTLAHNTRQESNACVCNSAACDRDCAGDEAGPNAGPGQLARMATASMGGEVFFNMPVHSAAARGRCPAVTRTGLVRRLQVRRTPQLGEGCPCKSTRTAWSLASTSSGAICTPSILTNKNLGPLGHQPGLKPCRRTYPANLVKDHHHP